MRRMRQALKRPYTLKKATATKNSEGNSYNTWGSPTTIDAIIRHASRSLDTAQSNSDPDYKVTSAKGLTEDTFNVYTLEAI